MNRVLPFLLTAVTILTIISAGYYFANTHTAQVSETQKTVTNEISQSSLHPETATITGTLGDLLRAGGEKQCMRMGESDEKSGVALTQVLYLSGKKFRSEITMTLPSQTASTFYAVGDGEKITSWISSDPRVKSTISYDEIKDHLSSHVNQAGSMLLQEHTYRCMPWKVDSSKFVTK